MSSCSWEKPPSFWPLEYKSVNIKIWLVQVKEKFKTFLQYYIHCVPNVLFPAMDLGITAIVNLINSFHIFFINLFSFIYRIALYIVLYSIHPPRKNVSLFQCLPFPSCMYYAPDFFSVGAYMCVHWPQENSLSANENFLFGGLLKVPYSVSIYQFSLSNNITKTFFNKRWSKSHLTNFLWRHQILPLISYALWKTKFENRPKNKREITFFRGGCTL